MPRGHRWRGGRASDEPHPRRIRRFLEPALLLLLHKGTSHGYDLMNSLHELGLETYPADASVVYRMLRDLEAQGMVTSFWDTESAAGPSRRVYRLTEAGDRYLAEWVADLQETDRLLHRFLEAYQDHMTHGKGEHHE